MPFPVLLLLWIDISPSFSEFTKEKDKTDRKELFRKERQQKREQQDYENYKEWIEIAGSFRTDINATYLFLDLSIGFFFNF